MAGTTIRYAKAERFGVPQPISVAGVDFPGPACPQPASRLEQVVGPRGDLPQDEDCLSLNVWTPGGEGLPVLVWLHGGGFSAGSGADAWNDGARLAERGRMVVVTVNYRLGALGYLYLGEEFGPANLGLLDQLAALEWVHANISAFGGDPARVTLGGQSAGALSTLAIPRRRDLFQQILLQSTPAGVPPYDPGTAVGIGQDLLALLGVRAEELRTVSVARLLDAQRELARRRAVPGQVTPPFQLVAADGVPADLVAGAPVDLPTLIGTTRDEARAYFPGESSEPTDRLFGDGSRRLARQADSAFAYRFHWAPAGGRFGACHCIELPFVFGNHDAWRSAPMLAGADPADLRRLTDEVQAAWAAFVHTGEPGWPRFPHVKHFA